MRVLVLLLLIPTSLFAHTGYELTLDHVTPLTLPQMVLSQPSPDIWVGSDSGTAQLAAPCMTSAEAQEALVQLAATCVER